MIINKKVKKERLSRKIKLAHNYKKRLANFIGDLDYKHKEGLINNSKYDRELKRVLKGRSAEYWLNYYDDYIRNAKEEISNIDKINVDKTVLILTLAVILILVSGGFLFKNIDLTTYSVKDANLEIQSKNTFTADEEPEFNIKFLDKEGNQITGFGLTIFDARKTLEALVINPNGQEIKLEKELKKTRQGYNIKLKKERDFKPGLYKLRVKIKDYVEEQDFLWGLISLNTKKSIYKPGEEAELIVVVLNKEGHAVSNADIELKVTNLDNEVKVLSTLNNEILETSDIGVYEANYLTEIEGIHKIDVKALIQGIEVNFQTDFLVKQDYEFDIIRTAQSKIDAKNKDSFEVKIDIESFVDLDSIIIKEFVPVEFELIDDGGATVAIKDDTKILTFTKDLIDGKTSISYKYDVPDIWPYLYSLGEVEINYADKVFREARPWYVAVDPVNLDITPQGSNPVCSSTAGCTTTSCDNVNLTTSDDSFTRVQGDANSFDSWVNTTHFTTIADFGSVIETTIRVEHVESQCGVVEVFYHKNSTDQWFNTSSGFSCITTEATQTSANLTEIVTKQDAENLQVAFGYNKGTANGPCRNADVDLIVVNVTYDLETIAPNITSPNANETTINQNNYFCLNITVDDNVGVSVVYAEVYDQSTTTNNTMTDTASTSCDGASSDNIFGVDIQGAIIGNYTYQAVYANDTSDNINYSDFEDINITVNALPAFPFFSTLTETPTDPATYEPNQFYEFNATVTDVDGDLDTVWIEHNFTGTITNYTTGVYNLSAVYTYNYTDLYATLYQYRWYANDSLGNENQTDLQYYTVNQNTSLVNLYLNDTRANMSILQDENVNKTGYSIVGEGDITLYQDGVLINNGTSPLENITVYPNVGTYNITLYHFETQNFTTGFEEWFVNVTDSQAPNITSPNANETSITQNDYFCLNITVDDNVAVDTVLAEVSNPNAVVSNNTMTETAGSCSGISTDNVFGVDIQGAIIGNYTYQAIFTNDTSNNVNYSDFEDINITVNAVPDNQAPNITSLTEDPNEPAFYNLTQFYEFNVTVDDNIGVDTVLFEHNFTQANFINETVYNLSSVYTFNITGIMVANHTYRWYANDTSDNLNVSDLQYYEVLQDVSSVNLYLNGTRSNFTINQDENVNKTGYSIVGEGDITLYQDGVLINNGTSPLENITVYPNVGTYNITLYHFETQNFTTGFEEWFVNVTDSQAPNITSPNANETSITQNDYFCLNITVDDNVAVDTVLAEVSNPNAVVSNNTMTETAGSCSGISTDNVFGVDIQGAIIGNYTYQAIFTNDTSNNVNYSDFEDINITVNPRELNVSIESPTDDQQVTQYTTFTVNATVTCINGDCGTVTGLSRYNISSLNPDTSINTTEGDVPLFVVEPLGTNYENQSDGFSTSALGAGDPKSITTNGSDFWIVDNTDAFVYHLDSQGNNQSDGFDIGSAGGDGARGITTNGSDFWITEGTDDFVYHFNSSGQNQSDGFDIINIGINESNGITTNGSDFWIVDAEYNFTYHLNSSGDNQSDGFDLNNIGAVLPKDVITNGSDFWITDRGNDFVYHVNSSGDNQSDGFNIGSAGSDSVIGITTELLFPQDLPGRTPTDFWITDEGDLFVYHFALSNQLSCGTLNQDQSCQLNWTINATGAINSAWELDVNFSSSDSNIASNDTEDRTILIISSTSGDSGSSGGSGGGSSGGSGTTADFTIDKDLIKVKIKQGESKRESVRITNTGKTILNINIESKLKEFIQIIEESFTLNLKESKIIDVYIFTREDEIPDIHEGKIIFRGDGITKTIKLIIEVLAKEPLFDIQTDVVNKKVAFNDSVKADIKIFNKGDLKNIDVTLFYAIKNFDGETLTFKEESLAINEQLKIERSLKITEDFLPDDYLFYTKVSYGNITAASSEVFEVIKPNILPTLLITFLFVMLIIFLLEANKRKGWIKKPIEKKPVDEPYLYSLNRGEELLKEEEDLYDSNIRPFNPI